MNIIAFLLAITGYFLNGYNNFTTKLLSYVTWIISNFMWAMIVDDNLLKAMFTIYMLFCCYNIYKTIKEYEQE